MKEQCAQAEATSPGASVASRASTKRGKAETPVEKLVAQRQATLRKEQELQELHKQVEQQERQLVDLTKTLGARSQRLDAAALTGPAKRVANDMAVTIRKKQERRKNTLRDKLQKLQSKLDNDLAHNKALRVEIDEMRHARLHHLNAIKLGENQVARRSTDISGMIVAAQRAYAERETCLLRLADLKKEVAQEATHWEGQIEAFEAEMSAVDQDCAKRDLEVAELERETKAALAVLRREEEAHEKQLEHYASIRNRRLEFAHGLEQLFTTLQVSSVAELVDAYTVTASKILSLWEKHGEQEQEVERLEEETKALQQKHERYTSDGADETVVPRSARTEGADDVFTGMSAEKKEAAFSSLCSAVQSALEKVPLLGADAASSTERPTITVNVHNLVALLGLIESAAVRTSRRYRALFPSAATDSQPPKEASTASERAHARSGGPKKGVSNRDFLPPSMEGIISHHHKLGDASDQVVGTGELRYGRKSLKAELMSQILGGVQTQMEKMHEEEMLVKIGEKMRESSTAPTIDKAFRDAQIDVWLNKRRASPAASAEVDAVTARCSSPSMRGGGDAAATKRTKQGGNPGSNDARPRSMSAASTPSSPQFFGNASSREVLESVSRINMDPKTARVSAAACLPRMAGSSGDHRPRTGSGKSCMINSASSPVIARSSKPRRGGQVSDHVRSAPEVPQDIAELNDRLNNLRKERAQIRELKELATIAGVGLCSKPSAACMAMDALGNLPSLVHSNPKPG